MHFLIRTISSEHKVGELFNLNVFFFFLETPCFFTLFSGVCWVFFLLTASEEGYFLQEAGIDPSLPFFLFFSSFFRGLLVFLLPRCCARHVQNRTVGSFTCPFARSLARSLAGCVEKHQSYTGISVGSFNIWFLFGV